MQIGALTCLFHLLDGFSHSEHSYAPYIYKTLIFALIENHANEVAREFIISNIIFTLEAMPHVPVGVMVPPIVKQASLYGYNNHDFDFFITLAKHPRLTLRHGLLLVDLLGKICLNDPLFGRVATVPFLILGKKSHHLCIYRISHHLCIYMYTYHIHHVTSPMYISNRISPRIIYIISHHLCI